MRIPIEYFIPLLCVSLFLGILFASMTRTAVSNHQIIEEAEEAEETEEETEEEE